MAWDNSVPANTEKIRNLGVVIRPNWEAIEENDSGVAATSMNQWVIHLIDRSTIGGVNTPARIDDVGMLYCRNDDNNNELFFQDSQNPANEVQLTLSDQVSIGASGTTCLPGALLMKWGTTAIPGTVGTTTTTFASAFPNAIYTVTATVQKAVASSSSAGQIPSAPIAASFGWYNNNSVAAYTLHWIAIGN